VSGIPTTPPMPGTEDSARLERQLRERQMLGESLADTVRRALEAGAVGQRARADLERALRRWDGTPEPADAEPIKAPGVRYMLAEEFREAGYFQEVNRRLLHPLGLALEVRIDAGGRIVGLGGIWDCRDDPEGINYQLDPEHAETAERRATFVDKEWASRREAREAALGYWIQPIEDVARER
jgi:hypothetical protein